MLAVVTVAMLLLISVMEPVSCVDTTNCPDLTSLPADCSCHVTTIDDPTHFTPSGNFLTIACGDLTGATNGTMTDSDVTNLVTTVIKPDTLVEAIGIYYQPWVTQVPTGLSQITNLKAVSMFGNAITAVDAADLTWTGLQEINLNANAITSVTGNFALTSTAEADGSGITRIDLSGNQQIPSLSSATFSLTGDSVYLSFSNNVISSVDAAVFTLTATQSITLDLESNSISSLSGTFNLVATDGTNDGSAVALLVGNNQLTTLSPATFNLNGAAGGVSFSFPRNSLASISTDDQITLQSTKKISIDLQDNQLTSLALASDTNTQPLTETQELIVFKNLLTSINCNDLGINSGVAEFFLDAKNNQITDVICGAGTPLDSAQKVTLDLSLNSINAISEGAFNFAGQVSFLALNNQTSPGLNSIAQASLPSNYANGSYIDLSANDLTSLDQGVFEPILQSFSAGNFDPTFTYIDASSNPNLDCGSPSGAQCGSEQWFLSDATLLPFVKGTCQNGNEFSSYSKEVCLCPPAADLGTCTCALTTDTTVTISCAGLSLDDSVVETLVDKIAWAPVDTFDLSGNLLTKVPANLASQLASVTTLSLASNGLTSIGSAELNLQATVVSLDVSNNSISTIATDGLPVNYASGSIINLSGNSLTSLDQGVFEPILRTFSDGSFDAATTFIDASLNPNLDCGSPSGDQCGSEQWLFSNATLLPFVKGTCQNGNEFSTYSNEVCLCPPAADLGECTCALTTDSTTAVTISCASLSLDDSAVETLVDKIAWAPIDSFDLSGNLLTKVPANLAPQLASVTTLSLASNGITSIGSAELNLQATVVSLDVSNNSISTIATDALPVNYASGSTIILSSNSLTSLDQGVFEPILRTFSEGIFDPTITYIDASSNPNLDCGSPSGDQCGSERWLFSNATLLPFVKGTCQNGNEFSTYSNEICLCPPAADLGTCTCALSTDSTTAVTISCADQQLDDSAVETLVNTISWAPIDTFDLSGNQMTKIPSGLSALVQLSSLSVATNQIASIGAADLSPLTAAVKLLNFASNSISTVDAGSFPAQFASGAQILFDANPLTALTQDAFEPVIKNFLSNGYSNSDTFISLVDTNQFDCDASTCGSESWLITNSEYKAFIQGDPQCSDGTVLKDIAATICWCPPSASTATCTCDLTAGSTTAITVNCTSQGLGDATMESVLLSISVTSPLDTLLLDGNNLTKVPSSSSRRMSGIVGSRAFTSLLARFPLLNYLSLASNAITSILKGDLALTAPLKFLDLSSNQISRVAVGSLPSSYENGAQILLDDNKLTGLDAAVFQPILDYFVKNGYPSSSTFISLSNNPINCNTDTSSSSSTCYANVGWLINSSNSLASFVQKGTCSDGKSISTVNKASCSQTQPTTTTTTRRPFKRKPLLEILAHSWVQSVLNSIFSSN